MRTRLVAVDALTDADWAAWRALADRAVEPNGWLDPVLVRPATRWRGMTTGLVAAIAEDDDAMRGLLVFTPEASRTLPFTRMTTAGRFMTWHADRHHPLIDASCVDEALGAVVTHAAASRAGHVLEIALFPTTGPLSEALDRCALARAIGVSTLAQIESVHASRGLAATAGEEDSPPSLERLIRGADGLSGPHRRKLWSKARLVAHDTGSPLAVEDWSGRPDLADRFVALQSRGWKGDESRGGAGFSTDPDYERWFRAVVADAQSRGALLALALTVEGRELALNTALVSGTTAAGFVDTYDEAFRTHGLGSLARVAMWRWALTARALDTFDPGLNGARPEATRLFPDSREYRHVVIGAGGAGRRMLGRRWGALTRAKERVVRQSR